MKKRIASQLALAALILAVIVPFAQAQYPRRDNRDNGQRAGQRIVQRTMQDLQRLQRRRGQTPKAYERYNNALGHLNEFSQKFARGNYDRDTLDTAIDDTKNVVNNNALPPRDKQTISRDLQDLRDFRANYR